MRKKKKLDKKIHNYDALATFLAGIAYGLFGMTFLINLIILSLFLK